MSSPTPRKRVMTDVAREGMPEEWVSRWWMVMGFPGKSLFRRVMGVKRNNMLSIISCVKEILKVGLRARARAFDVQVKPDEIQVYEYQTPHVMTSGGSITRKS